MPLVHGVTSTVMMLLEMSLPELSTATAPHPCMPTNQGVALCLLAAGRWLGSWEKQGATTQGVGGF